MLNKLITRASLEDFAGTTAFRRGEEYFSVGAVRRLRATGDKVTAKVEGTRTYQVELRSDDGDLIYDCTCPRTADGYFCKHCVAIGLAWLAENFAILKSGAAFRQEEAARSVARHQGVSDHASAGSLDRSVAG